MSWVRLVGMTVVLGCVPVATRLIGDGTAQQFSLEPGYAPATAGQNLLVGGCLLFAGLAGLGFLLMRRWWVAAGLMAPVLIAVVGSMIFSTWGAGLAAFLGVPLAFAGAGAGVLVALAELVGAVKARRAAQHAV